MGKKIAFLNIYQGKVDRGAETFVEEVSKRLKNNFSVDVISKINYFDIFKKKYDVIVPVNGRLQVFLVRIVSWLSGAKMVVSGQSGLGADDKWNLLCMPDMFVALTNYQESWAINLKKNISTRVIPNGVDLKEFNTNKKHTDIHLPHPIILTVGALEAIKRQDLIIKAVAKTKASLLIVGKGSRESELKQLGEEIMPGRLRIVSSKHSEMSKIYNSANLFTYSTLPWESFGIVMVEAMASNLPVVASDDPIRKEIVGRAGYFVDPTDTDKYVEVLEKTLNKKWGSIPRKQAEKFSWDEIAQKYVQLFEEIC